MGMEGGEARWWEVGFCFLLIVGGLSLGAFLFWTGLVDILKRLS